MGDREGNDKKKMWTVRSVQRCPEGINKCNSGGRERKAQEGDAVGKCVETHLE